MELTVTPTVKLSVTLTGPGDFLLQDGQDFDVNITIQHAPNSSHEAYDVRVFLDYCEEFVSAPRNFIAHYDDGFAERVFGKHAEQF